ncbi:MAG: hypothetical protein ACOWWM_02920 [Desulfobacterales bacterium]
MKSDPFGNLQEWGAVLELLSDLEKNGKLSENQKGLIRILRFRNNWRLREEVLKAMEGVDDPIDELIEAVLAIATDEGVYVDARILAARALEGLMSNRRKQAGEDASESLTQDRIEGSLRSIIETPQPPVLRDAVEACLLSIIELKPATLFQACRKG